MWRTIQTKAGLSTPIQLMIDMKVRWSQHTLCWIVQNRKKRYSQISVLLRSTYGGFQCVDSFVDELHWEETDSTKWDKIRKLELNSEEWG
jgi:hypothetical protein